jgi:hypothetical protein
MTRALLPALPALLLGWLCVQETKPQQDPGQAVREIPGAERLTWWCAARPGSPAGLAADEEALAKKRICGPATRRGRYLAVMLRNTLESSAQWGAVRVAPDSVQFVDLAVSGQDNRVDRKRLVLEVSQDVAVASG